MKSEDLVRSATRVLRLLEALNRRQVATLAQLQASLGLPKPTIVRLLHTLIRDGYARQISRAQGYAVTERVLNLSQGFWQADLVVAAALAGMDAFTARHKWPASLQTYDRGAMRGRYSTLAASPLASDPPRLNQRFPMLTTAHGQAYLAFCSPAEREMILAMLRASKKPANAMANDPAAVAAMLAQVLDQGYAVRRATPRDRVVGFAVPVIKEDGVAATVGMRYFASAMKPDEAVRRYLGPLRDLAAAISTNLARAGAGVAAGVLSADQAERAGEAQQQQGDA
ncbi:MAG: DNA-binding transcriptional regulator [Caulobacterales bacterium]